MVLITRENPYRIKISRSQWKKIFAAFKQYIHLAINHLSQYESGAIIITTNTILSSHNTAGIILIVFLFNTVFLLFSGNVTICLIVDKEKYRVSVVSLSLIAHLIMVLKSFY